MIGWLPGTIVDPLNNACVTVKLCSLRLSQPLSGHAQRETPIHVATVIDEPIDYVVAGEPSCLADLVPIDQLFGNFKKSAVKAIALGIQPNR